MKKSSMKKRDHHDSTLHMAKDLAVIAFCLAGIYAAVKVSQLAKEAEPVIEGAKKNPLFGGKGD